MAHLHKCFYDTWLASAATKHAAQWRSTMMDMRAGNDDGSGNDNTSYGSGSDGPTFDPITKPRSHIGLSGDNDNGAVVTL